MNTLNSDRFPEFYEAVHGYAPFPWQRRLANRVCALGREWPQAIALPTAAGKTACIDVAVFALACQAVRTPGERTAARRIFFVVDRRVVVDQAYLHAKEIARRLRRPGSEIEQAVANALRDLAHPGWRDLASSRQGEIQPLDVYVLRGGIYRDNAWIRSPLQPTVITSTVDQVGSRLLFRGYGVSDSMKPIHAALVGNDALILLDEAHCSRPFDQTMRAVEMYRQWGSEATSVPFHFVPITATAAKPGGEPQADDVECDQDDDRNHQVLGKRINASKPARLEVAKKATGKKWRGELVKELAEQSRKLMGQSLGCDDQGTEHFVSAVGVIVNRVATARELAVALDTDGVDVILLTGRMRPIDRDVVIERLDPLFSGKSGVLPKPTFVVATQCLEVGADLDFHALVTECASLDTLRQRFGRLNRVAARPSAKAAIVIRGDQTENSTDDPIYGDSLANTWQWLKSKVTDNIFDFGIAAVRMATEGVDLSPYSPPTLEAPALCPAQLDCWVQTNPIPIPDPDPAAFLHGPQSGVPDVQVAFRDDLGDDSDIWTDIVSLCPPSSSETVPVRLDVFCRWLAGDETRDESSDVEGEASPKLETLTTVSRTVLRWAGPEKSGVVSMSDEVHPGDTFVVRTTESSLDRLGDFLTLPPSDLGEQAFQKSRGKAILRLSGSKLNQEDEEFDRDLTAEIEARCTEGTARWLSRAVENLKDPKKRKVDKYPAPMTGFVVTGKHRLPELDDDFTPTLLEDDESAESPKGEAILLEDHSRGVADYASRFASGCGLPSELYAQVGFWHDLGKLDPRFQAMLKGRSPRTAGGPPLAKSGSFGSSDRLVHRYPKKARHELLSASMLAGRSSDDLLLHLVATHHGHGRPFMDPVTENEAAIAPFKAKLFENTFHLTSAAQLPESWNADLSERFWRMVRRFGWWGEALYEAVFRLADHAQSRAEQEPNWQPVPSRTCLLEIQFAPTPIQSLVPLELSGLDGSNPLGFLAAVGTLRSLTECSNGASRPHWLTGPPVRLSWGTTNSSSVAVIHLPTRVGAKELAEFLAGNLIRDLDDHPVRFVLDLMSLSDSDDASRLLRKQTKAATRERRSEIDWANAMYSPDAPGATNQLMMVRRDYLEGNLRSVLGLTTSDHIERSIFQRWDYRDPLQNRSLHWEPGEDRRHAYQWHEPNGDPTRKRCGGMLGANRLAIEAWPFFFSVPAADRLQTRGFTGNRTYNTYWTWPLWSLPLGSDAIASLMALPDLRELQPDPAGLRSYGIIRTFRCRRILVGKTPNLTPAVTV